MKTHTKNQNSRLQHRPEQVNTDGKRSKRNCVDPNQTEFVGIIWQSAAHPFRLRAGDVFRYENRLCRVLRVNESEAVVIMNQPVRDFKTRFDKPVRFQPPPRRFYVSSNSEVEILNRKSA
jgi:hypothetical protein